MKINNCSIAIVAIMTLCGCNKKMGDPTTTERDNPVPLEINVGVSRKNAAKQMIQSKASIVTDSAFKNEQKINVVLVDHNPLKPSPDDYPDALPFVCAVTTNGQVSTTTWKPTTPDDPLKVMLSPATVLAYFPSTMDLSADSRKVDIKIPSTMDYGPINSMDYNQVPIAIPNITPAPEVYFTNAEDDCMVGLGEDSVTSRPDPVTKLPANNVNIKMKHALSMIVLQFKMDKSNPESNNHISYISIDKAQHSATPSIHRWIDIATNTFDTDLDRINTYERTMSEFPINMSYYFGMMVYPETIANTGDILVKCTVGKVKYTYKVPAIEWKPGLVYLYTLNLKAASGVVGDEVRVIDWPTTIVNKVELE